MPSWAKGSLHMNVLVIGSSGFVGRRLSNALLGVGHRVRCLARNPEKVQDLEKAGCEILKGDISDLASLKLATTTIEAIYISIHTLSAQSATVSGRGFMDIEMKGLENIVNAGKNNGCRRLIYITAMGTSSQARSIWLRERWKAEQFLLNCNLDVTVLRPAQIVGVGGQGFDMMVASAKRSFAVDLFGTGQQQMQNIAVDDLVYYLVGVLRDARSFRQAFNVGCDDVLTNDQMIDVAADVLGRPHPKKVHLPRILISLFAPLLESAAKLPKGSVKAILDGADVPMTGDCLPIREILTRPLEPYRQAVETALNTSAS